MTATEKIDILPSEQAAHHYHGHRDRLRKRLVQNGPDSLADYELLEIILFSAIPRRDVKPLAKSLLLKFGSLPALVSATLPELQSIEGISENTAILIKTTTALALRTVKQDLMKKPILNSWARLMDYCHASMAHEKKEHFRILFLNKKNELIADEIQGSGTVDHTPAYPREIIKRALEHGATAIILMHNHPSGDSKPSKADIDMTQAIIRAAQPLNITIHDHIVIAKGGYTSFRSEGLI
ncbi:MAG: DNA repair protein RadC [Alphaproteobacteria bacterium]|nr:DNA repair protein RadC [Alphaproteobacteria bacterium]MCB1782764.1 DNA repair protein RadC [Alphaproteobacteria bacterium]